MLSDTDNVSCASLIFLFCLLKFEAFVLNLSLVHAEVDGDLKYSKKLGLPSSLE